MLPKLDGYQVSSEFIKRDIQVNVVNKGLLEYTDIRKSIVDNIKNNMSL